MANIKQTRQLTL